MAFIFTRQELITQGIDPHEIRRRLQSGSLLRVRRGYYAFASTHENERWQVLRAAHRLRVEAAVAAAHCPVVVSHVSAGVIHDLPAPYKSLDTVHLTQPSRRNGRVRPGVRRATAPLDSRDIVQVGGLQVTSIARTLVDLGRTLTPGWALAAVDEGLHRGLCSREAVEDALSRCGRLPRVGAARRAVIAADEGAESVGESLSRELLARFGLAPDALQVEFPHRTGTDRVDMWWSCGVIGEFDGRKKYLANENLGVSEKDAVWQEKQREDRLRRQGYVIVRWTWDDLIQRPMEVVAWVRAALEERRMRSA